MVWLAMLMAGACACHVLGSSNEQEHRQRAGTEAGSKNKARKQRANDKHTRIAQSMISQGNTGWVHGPQ